MSIAAPHVAEHGHHEPGFLGKYMFSQDHKIIGIQFLFTSIIFLGVGGMLALLVRIQLGWPHAEIPIISGFFKDNGGRISESAYNMFFTMHATIDRKSTRLNSSHLARSRMPSSA